jgi:hypothetical protein
MRDQDLRELIGPCGEVKRHKQLLLWRAQLAQQARDGLETLASGHTIMIGDSNEVRVAEVMPSLPDGGASYRMMILRSNGTLDIWGETLQTSIPRKRITWGRRVDRSVEALDKVMVEGIVALSDITKKLRGR